MKWGLSGVSSSLIAILLSTSAMAQDFQNPPAGSPSPASAAGGQAGGATGYYSGYVPSATYGMFVSENADPPAEAGRDGQKASTPADQVQQNGAVAAAGPRKREPENKYGIPGLSDGNVVTAEKIEGFNAAVEQNYPMTPDMVRARRDIHEAQERALLEREEPKARVDAGFISLEPGEEPTQFHVAPGIASVIGFYDVTGQPWPIEKYVLGNGNNFQVVQLGSASNNVAITPLVRYGFTNMIVVLQGQAKPVVMKVNISEDTAHFRHDVQVMARGPMAATNTAANENAVREAGSGLLLAALAGVDLPADARPVSISGVDARAWLVNGKLLVRSKHALLSPTWQGSMSGPDGIRVYEIQPSYFANFSVDGQIVRADVQLP